MKFVSAALALVMLCSAPLAASAQRGGGGGGGGARGGGGGARGGGGAPAARSAPAPAAPAARQAPAMRPAAPAGESGGFNLGTEFVRPNAPPVQAARPAAQARPVNPPANGGSYSRPSGNVAGYTRPPNDTRPPGGYPQRPQPPSGGYAPARPSHTVIANPGYHGQAWGWNGGVRWNPANGYWGGGFWGGFALAAISAYAYGSIVDAQNQTVYSYEVAPGSPGAQLLQNYQLTQTDCGQSDLVIIYGPDNSLICAYPNQNVGPGNYTVDPTGLTLQSE